MSDSISQATAGRILAVDDNPGDLQFLLTVLRSKGHTVFPTSESLWAMQNVQAVLPDLILLDAHMPGMDGYQLCDYIKANTLTRDIPVIFVSGSGGVLDKVTAFSKGGVDYILKPYQAEEVLARVRTHLSLRERTLALTRAKCELERQNDELKALAAAAEQATRSKSMFLANVNHELRSPLNAMLGFSRLLLRDDSLSERSRKDVSIILSSGEQLHTLINQVLELSKIEAERASLNPVDFNLHALLDELRELFALSARRKGLLLDFQISADVPRYVQADAIKLRQVLVNLLGNAVKFTFRGQVELKVRNVAVGRLGFTVSDSGVGIAPEELASLGQAFVQAQAGRQSAEGTGLGLAISRNFVSLMGSNLRLRSESGQGTSAFFDIPVNVVQAPPEKRLNRIRRVVGLTGATPAPRILVADDWARSRELVVRLLEPMGFELREAANGQEALEVWQQWSPHLILMDMRMPVMDGRETTRCIKATEQGRTTVIVALTASSFEEQRADILAIGCDDYVRKPFLEVVLLEVLSRNLKLEYQYEEEPAGFDQDEEAVPDMQVPGLSALPKHVLAELRSALSRLDVLAIEKALLGVREHDAGAAAAMAPMVEVYEYESLLAIVARACDD